MIWYGTRLKLKDALLSAGFVLEERQSNFENESFLFVALSDRNVAIRLPLSHYDSIESISERLMDFIFRSRGLSKVTKKELYRLTERVKANYIKE